MERTMSVEERIKRAEDIYNRKNGYQYTRKRENKITRKKGNIKKLFMQIFICLFIYIIFYAITNKEHVFSEEFRKEVKTFFSEKTKISEWYNNAKIFVKNKFDGNDNIDSSQTNEEVNKEGNSEEKKEVQENQIKSGEEVSMLTEKDIGGAIEKESLAPNVKLSEEELMKKYAEEIKKKVNFILPIQGRISSTFGWRNPTTSTVPKYHTGIDIAANEGTIIKSATDGKITMTSSKGDYGNHYRIEIGDVVIIYAHCKKLYFKEGDLVKQGQEIAEVGSTGNSTGPHLHFEVRKGDTKIDPQLILNI